MKLEDYDPEVLKSSLDTWNTQSTLAAESLYRSFSQGEVDKEEVVDVILAADNLRGAAEQIADHADVDLDE